MAKAREKSDAILGIRDNVLNRLGHAIELIEDETSKARLRRECETLHGLELRFVIAAPMNAGKSTLIDAIVGEDVLPRRNMAMTVFPCDVVLEPAATGFRLELDRTLHAQAVKALESMRGKVTKEQIAEVNPALQDILEGEGLPAGAEGVESIRGVLELLNDIGRLSRLHAGSKNLLSEFDVSQSPRLTAPLPGHIAAGPSGKARLVIVDTPGPNEAGGNHLSGVLGDSLDRAAMILLVLDYTQLNAGAAADVRDKVMGVLQAVPGDRLVVVVNKVDQRRNTQDLSKDGVVDFVRAHIAPKLRDDRLFEVTAESALAASRARRYLDSAGDAFDPNDGRVQTLFSIRFPLDFAEELARLAEDPPATRFAEVRRAVNRLWAQSGLERLLSQVITDLVENAGPRLVAHAIEIAQGEIGKFDNSTSLRAVTSSLEELRAQIERLEDQRRSVQQRNTTVRADIKGRRRALEASLNTRRDQLSATIHRKLEGELKGLRKPKKGLLARLGLKPDRSGKQLEFDNKSDAKAARDKLEAHVNNLLDKHGADAVSNLRRDVENATQSITALCTNHIAAVRAEVRDHIREAFSVELRLPSLEISAQLVLEEGDVVVEKDEREVQKQRKKEVWWNFWGFFDWGYESYTGSQSVYILDVEHIQKRAAQRVDKQVEDLTAALRDYLDNKFGAELDAYFKVLDDDFKRVGAALDQAEEDRGKSESEQAAIHARLQRHSTQAHELFEALAVESRKLETLRSTATEAP